MSLTDHILRYAAILATIGLLVSAEWAFLDRMFEVPGVELAVGVE